MIEQVGNWILSFMSTRSQHILATTQVSVGTTAKQVLSRNPIRFGAVVTNAGTGTIYVGNSGDSLANVGHALPAGNSLSLVSSAEVWAVSDSSGPYTVTTLMELPG